MHSSYFQGMIKGCSITSETHTLPETNIAGWKMHLDWRCISYSRWWFSIAMLVYQRVVFRFHCHSQFRWARICRAIFFWRYHPLPPRGWPSHYFQQKSEASVGQTLVFLKRSLKHHLNYPTLAGWWFQPIRKILVKMRIFPKFSGWK